MNDKKTGYVLFLLFTLICMSFGAYSFLTLSQPLQTHTVHIEQIGSLSIEDPVRIRGVEMGEVRTIKSNNDYAELIIALRKPVTIYTNYKIIIMVKGVMGERFLALDPGDSSHAAISKNQILKGTIMQGPSEAIAQINELQLKIKQLSTQMNLLASGSPETLSLIEHFTRFTANVDSLVINLVGAFIEIDNKTSSTIDTFSESLVNLQQFVAALDNTASDHINSLENLIVTVSNLVNHINSIITIIDAHLEHFQTADAQKLSELLKEIQYQIKVLGTTIDDIKNDGLKLPIHPNL